MHERIEITAEPEVNIRLTVAIPTFDRNEILKINLAKLIPQLTPACELVILDNCSPVPVEDTLNDILASVPENIKVRIIRHRANVGANENILRCIEFAQGEFVWLLSDDNQPVDSAVANIFQELDEHPEVLVLNMYAPNPKHTLRTSTEIVVGSTGYLTASNVFGELILISSMILKIDCALHYMAVAHLWQSSHAPHLIVAVMMLRPNGMSVFSSREVVDNGIVTTPKEKQNSPIPIALGFSTLVLASWNEEEARHIISLLKNTQQEWMTPKGVVNQLISIASQGGNEGRCLALRYYYLLLRNFYAIGHPLSIERILFACAWPMVACPKMGRIIRNIAWRVFRGLPYDSGQEFSLHR